MHDQFGGLYRELNELAEDFRLAKMGELRDPRSITEPIMHPPAFWRWIADESLVILDEIGAKTAVSDHVFETLVTLLNKRECKPLVLLSNLSLPEIERLFDDRVASRMASGTVCELAGPDRRIERDSR